MSIEFDSQALVRDYGDSRAEARAARRASALFDFSFMARARLRGSEAIALLTSFQTRRIDTMQTGQIRYGLRLDERGRIAADLTVWKHADSVEVFSGRQCDIDALGALAATNPGVVFEDLSASSAIFALQGPTSLAALRGLVGTSQLAELGYFRFSALPIAKASCLIGRLGYTGERGFEIVIPRDAATRVWSLLAEQARPAGFAAADSLRIEAGFILFANECRMQATAEELDLAAFAPPASAAPRFRLVCFLAECHHDPSLWQPPRSPLPVPMAEQITVSSACYSTVAGAVLGLGFVSRQSATTAHSITDPTGEFYNIQLVNKPYYDPHKRRPRQAWHDLDY